MGLMPLFAVTEYLFYRIALQLLVLANIMRNGLGLATSKSSLTPLGFSTTSFCIHSAITRLPRRRTIRNNLLGEKQDKGNNLLHGDEATANICNGFTITNEQGVGHTVTLRHRQYNKSEEIYCNVTFDYYRYDKGVFANNEGLRDIRITNAYGVAVRHFRNTIAYGTTTGLPNNSKSSSLTNGPTFFTGAIVVRNPAWEDPGTAELPTSKAYNALLRVATRRAKGPTHGDTT